MSDRSGRSGDDSTTDDSGLDPGEIAGVLADSPMTVLGRMPWSSNATFLVDFNTTSNPADIGSDTPTIRGVYKPGAGEQPLWDFPSGLWRREVASYELSNAMGLDVVPMTVQREDGPFGEGSVQLFIDTRFDEHYFTIRRMESDHLDNQLRVLCAFDLIANSADRKGGHTLIDGADHIWGIDNGLTFHTELKLRTVIWDFAEEPFPAMVQKALEDLHAAGPPDSISDLLSVEEIEAMLRRTELLINSGCYPSDPSGRRYPWPLV